MEELLKQILDGLGMIKIEFSYISSNMASKSDIEDIKREQLTSKLDIEDIKKDLNEIKESVHRIEKSQPDDIYAL